MHPTRVLGRRFRRVPRPAGEPAAPVRGAGPSGEGPPVVPDAGPVGPGGTGPGRPRAVRWVPAALVGAVQVMGSLAASHGQHGRLVPDTPLALALLLAGPVALLGRRPVPRAVVAVAAAAAYLALGYAFGPVLLSAAIALVLAVTAGRRGPAWLVLVGGVLGAAVASRWGPRPLHVLPVLQFGVWGLVLLALAEVVRGRREAAAVWARARAQERLRQAGEERLQIARDLHDGVAHQISLISVRAGVALHLLDSGGPGAAEEAHLALAAIRQASGEALAELRSALRLLRAEGEAAPRHPVPGLDGLPELALQWAGAGLAVRVDAGAGQLPAAVEQTAYRVVQEALTNVSQHSAADRAQVRLSREGDLLTVVVDDPGPARTPRTADPAGGRGLVGMRERVTALGGTVAAGPDGAGWTVRAQLPAGPPP